ncbi:MAG: sulfotransferase domain-containing protein [Anaerolineae bacterium]|nr:sulfotransferase domain-containing protein [Anaerolineae bacterium]
MHLVPKHISLPTTRESLDEFRQRTQRFSERRLKLFRQFFLFPNATASPLFILGVQRSGTNSLFDMLDESLSVLTYNEHNPVAFDNYRIRDAAARQQLINRAHCEWVAFKPICDVQHAAELLDSHAGGKAIWIFRHYTDVANSAINKWGRGQYHHIERLAMVDNCTHWFCENVDPDTRALINHFFLAGISDHEAGILKWYVRNQWFFTLKLFERRDHVLLIQYEDLVRDSASIGQKVFDFLNVRFDPRYVDHFHEYSIRKSDFPAIKPEIQELCDDLLQKLIREAHKA